MFVYFIFSITWRINFIIHVRCDEICWDLHNFIQSGLVCYIMYYVSSSIFDQIHAYKYLMFWSTRMRYMCLHGLCTPFSEQWKWHLKFSWKTTFGLGKIDQNWDRDAISVLALKLKDFSHPRHLIKSVVHFVKRIFERYTHRWNYKEKWCSILISLKWLLYFMIGTQKSN